MARLLTIGELAARSGVAPSALRYYERLGPDPRRPDRRQPAPVRPHRAAPGGVHPDLPSRSASRWRRSATALASLPAEPHPDQGRLGAAVRAAGGARLDERIALLERLRDQLTGCIGCGCLSLQRCTLFNPGDSLAGEGPGARLVLPRRDGPVTPSSSPHPRLPGLIRSGAGEASRSRRWPSGRGRHAVVSSTLPSGRWTRPAGAPAAASASAAAGRRSAGSRPPRPAATPAPVRPGRSSAFSASGRARSAVAETDARLPSARPGPARPCARPACRSPPAGRRSASAATFRAR